VLEGFNEAKALHAAKQATNEYGRKTRDEKKSSPPFKNRCVTRIEMRRWIVSANDDVHI